MAYLDYFAENKDPRKDSRNFRHTASNQESPYYNLENIIFFSPQAFC